MPDNLARLSMALVIGTLLIWIGDAELDVSAGWPNATAVAAKMETIERIFQTLNRMEIGFIFPTLLPAQKIVKPKVGTDSTN